MRSRNRRRPSNGNHSVCSCCGNHAGASIACELSGTRVAGVLICIAWVDWDSARGASSHTRSSTESNTSFLRSAARACAYFWRHV
jgi:hypothetical protein